MIRRFFTDGLVWVVAAVLIVGYAVGRSVGAGLVGGYWGA